MKTRHLVIGLSLVLALSMAVPALGGPLALRSNGISSVKLLVKKALSAATAAQGAASTAQGTATAAQGAAAGAQGAAAGAQSTANNAQTTANAAKSAASTAQSAANGAQTTANGAQSEARTAQATATGAENIAKAKMGNAIQVSEIGSTTGLHEQVAEAICPANTHVSGGGYGTGGNSSVKVFISEPEGNGWIVYARSDEGDFSLRAWAMCMTP